MPDTYASVKIIIKNKAGFHVRPITAFVQTSSKFESTLRVKYQDQVINGKSVLECTLLAAPSEAELFLEAEGEDAELLIRELEMLAENKFGIDD